MVLLYAQNWVAVENSYTLDCMYGKIGTNSSLFLKPLPCIAKNAIAYTLHAQRTSAHPQSASLCYEVDPTF